MTSFKTSTNFVNFLQSQNANSRCTTMAVGEEGGGKPPQPIGPPDVSTMAVGEEGGGMITTEAVGEEGGCQVYTELNNVLENTNSFLDFKEAMQS